MNKLPSDYHIVVAGKDRADIYYYYRGMAEFINRKEPVPYQIVQSFLALLNDLEGFGDAKLDADSELKAAVAEQRLSTFKDYSFEYTDSDGTLVPFKEILRLSIRGYLEKYKLEEIESKKPVIRFFFDGLNEYFKPKISPEKGKKITDYKMAVIAAVLTEVCWTKITPYKTPTARQLHQWTKHHLK